METLHIEHPISDLETWFGAFNRFAEARSRAGSDASPALAGKPLARVLTDVSTPTGGTG
jgi:hypothetical protein